MAVRVILTGWHSRYTERPIITVVMGFMTAMSSGILTAELAGEKLLLE